MYAEIAKVQASITEVFAADGVAVTFTGNVKVTPEIAAVWYEISYEGTVSWITPDAADFAAVGETLIATDADEMAEVVGYVADYRADFPAPSTGYAPGAEA